MATPSGISPSSPTSVQEIRRIKKRKFEGYLLYEEYVQLRNDFVNYHARICDICRRIVFDSKEEPLSKSEEPLSKSPTDAQVEDMILSHMEVIYWKVIKDLTSYGYTEANAINAILATGICYGCKDSIANSLKHALTFLMCKMDVEKLENQNIAKDLRTLGRFVTMVEYNGRKKHCPILCMDDFLFWLLVYKMPHFDSSIMGCDSFNSSESQKVLNSPTNLRFKEESSSDTSTTTQFIPEGAAIGAYELNLSSPHLDNDSKLELTPIRGILGLSSSFLHLGFPIPIIDAVEEKPISPYDSLVDKCSSLMISETSISEEKPVDDNLKHEASSKRDFTLCHCLERRRQYSRLSGKAKKTSTLANQFMEKPKSTILHSTSSWLNSNATDGLKTLESAANITSMPFETRSDVCSKPDYSAANISYFKSDEMLEKLIFHSKDLQLQLQEWTNWAHFKVREIIEKLQRDKAKLKALRQEKYEAAKENEAMEDTMMEKIRDMESALSWARTQYEKATDVIYDLEIEKIKLKQELEVVKVHAKGSATDSQEASMRELTTLKKIQSRDRERTLLQEDLSIEKCKLSKLQKQFQEAQDYHGQLEARLRNEEKLKLEQHTKAINERKEQSKQEASAKSKEDMIRLESESHIQKYRDNIQKLRHRIAELNLMIESSKFSSLTWAQNAYFTTDIKGFKKSEIRDVQHDWECVMCLTEEISVVFLPCAHQVVCKKCNELHKKQGLKDCPFCRTLIQHRICIHST